MGHIAKLMWDWATAMQSFDQIRGIFKMSQKNTSSLTITKFKTLKLQLSKGSKWRNYNEYILQSNRR